MADPTVRLTLPADPSILYEVRAHVERAGQRTLSRTECEDLKLAVNEACANAVLHSGTQEVRVSITPRGSCVEVTVEDDGVYPDSIPSLADPEAASGRGLALIAAMVDELSLRRGTNVSTGTTVWMRKCAS